MAHTRDTARPGMVLMPIDGMDLRVQRCAMGMGLTLAAPTKREVALLKTIWTSSATEGPFPAWPDQLRCVARLAVPIRWQTVRFQAHTGVLPSSIGPPQELDVLTFLRLLKPGRIQAPRTLVLRDRGMPCASDWAANPECAVPWVIREEKQYHFVRSDVAAARRLWRALVPVAQAYPPSFDQALRRFNRSYSYRPIDAAERVAELIAGLEALYLYETEELAYRLALRCAAILGSNGESVGRIFRGIKASYTVRSKVVHGETVRERVRIAGEEFSLEELGDVLEDYLRRSLRIYLRLLPHASERTIKGRLLDELVLDRTSSRLMRMGLARYRRFA